jgi:hypothetical protein
MKTLIIAGTFALSSIFASEVVAQDFTAVVPGGPIVRDARIYPLSPNEGALQAAVREGNVLQAVNPAAPARFQSNGKFVATEVGDPFKNPNLSVAYPYGVVLLSFEF